MLLEYTLDELDDLDFPIDKPSIVFLKGDLGAGKTTISQCIIRKTGVLEDVTSPTYTYYNKYFSESQQISIYHFDLYRISDYEEFIHIGGEEILDNNEGIILIEWPEILEGAYKADLVIEINNTQHKNTRQLQLTKKGE